MNRIIFLFVILILICAVDDSAFGQETKANPVVVMLDKGPSGFVTKVNSKIPAKDLLLTLSQMREAEIRSEGESVLLVHEAASFSMLYDLLGIMAKAGYLHPRVLFFNRHKDWMIEITISGVIPFSEREIQK